MVDWERVERDRARGWDWNRIASDPAVGFHPDAAAGSPGRALETLYRRQGRRAVGTAARGPGGREKGESRWSLARVSWIVFPLCGIWFVLAYFLPSPVGVYAPAIPELGIVFAASGFLWAYALLRSEKRWTPVFRTSLVSGIVLGLVVAGALGLAAAAQQCPVLSPSYTSEPSLWQKSPNSPWQEGGKPVLFLYASVACPFCSASSWAIWKALAGFGTLSGATLGTSSPTDVYPNTPEVVFAGTSFSSSYISFDARENTNDAQIEAPALVGCTELAYVNAYGHGSFPFLVVNGIYWHSGTLLSPANLSGYTPDQVAQQVGNESGPAWNAVAPATYMLEAFLVKATGGQPASVASNANVQADLAQIT